MKKHLQLIGFMSIVGATTVACGASSISEKDACNMGMASFQENLATYKDPTRDIETKGTEPKCVNFSSISDRGKAQIEITYLRQSYDLVSLAPIKRQWTTPRQTSVQYRFTRTDQGWKISDVSESPPQPSKSPNLKEKVKQGKEVKRQRLIELYEKQNRDHYLTKEEMKELQELDRLQN